MNVPTNTYLTMKYDWAIVRIHISNAFSLQLKIFSKSLSCISESFDQKTRYWTLKQSSKTFQLTMRLISELYSWAQTVSLLFLCNNIMNIIFCNTTQIEVRINIHMEIKKMGCCIILNKEKISMSFSKHHLW